MNMSSEQARSALEQAESMSEATRMVAAWSGTDVVVMTWGAIWGAGFLWSHWVEAQGWPGIFHMLWFILVGIGVVVTTIFEKRREAPIKNSVSRRIGIFWWALFGYYGLCMTVFGRYLNAEMLNCTADGPKAIAAMNTIIPMFAYVVMGLWLEHNGFVYLGLGLTGLTVLAYLAFNPIFFLVMAFMGGGILFGSGLWMRVRWIRAMKRLGEDASA